MRTLEYLSVLVLYLVLGAVIACAGSRKVYYPIVSERSGNRVTVKIERRADEILITFPDSILQVGDTVQFFRGSVPMNVKIWDAYEEFRPLIIRP